MNQNPQGQPETRQGLSLTFHDEAEGIIMLSEIRERAYDPSYV